jgi:WD40 repeat protein
VPQTSFSQDGRRIACLATALSSTDGKITIKLIDLNNEGFRVLEPQGEPPWSVCMAPDGRQFVAAGLGNELEIWDFDTGQVVKVLEPPDGVKAVGILLVAYNPAGDQIVSFDRNGGIRVWEPKTGRLLLSAAGSKREIRAVAFGKDRVKVASGGFHLVAHKVFEPLVIRDFKFDISSDRP